MNPKPWYQRYGELRDEVVRLQSEYHKRCRDLGGSISTVYREIWRDLIARAVKESNWQEGIELGEPRTLELANASFDEFPEIKGHHLDIDGIVGAHRMHIIRFKRQGAAPEEIAAYNLSRAHQVLGFIGHELASRENACLIHALKQVEGSYEEMKSRLPPDALETIRKGFETVREVEASTLPVQFPMTNNIATKGELFLHLSTLPFEDLLHPMRDAYIHFLHRLLFMGVLPPAKMGVYRKVSVHIENTDRIFFPPPSLVGKMMEEYCAKFPKVISNPDGYDSIMAAAKASHRLVAIHPYSDGNGRISRLLMNLVLWVERYPPVYLKADLKGRHRYIQSLRRADRGNCEPLACLIAMSLVEIYKRMISALRV